MRGPVQRSNVYAEPAVGGAVEGARQSSDCSAHVADSDETSRVRVMILVSSLEHGGAERQVVELANRVDTRRFAVSVCSLSSEVPLARDLVDRRRRLHIVEKYWRYDISTIYRVARLMRAQRIQIVHAVLFDAEIVARLAARWAGVPVVIASERNSDYRIHWSHWAAQRLTRGWIDAMIANSEAGRRFNVRKYGIDENRVHVVRNGVDTERFRPLDRVAARRRLEIAADIPVVGMIAIFKRQKRHPDFFRMAQRTLRRFPNALFVCVGEAMRDNQQGAEDYRREVGRFVRSLGLEPHCRFLGRRDDMPEVYSMCDVTVLPSSREGTPNVLLESMACGVPVVATDVSDNAQVVSDGEVGFVVPLGDVEALSAHVCAILSDAELRARLGRAARQWVMREFSTNVLARKTEAVYLQTLERKLFCNDGRH